MTTTTTPEIERPDFTMVAENKERPELGITGIRHHPDGCKGTTRWSPRPGTPEELAKTRPCAMCIKSLAKGATAPAPEAPAPVAVPEPEPVVEAAPVDEVAAKREARNAAQRARRASKKGKG